MSKEFSSQLPMSIETASEKILKIQQGFKEGKIKPKTCASSFVEKATEEIVRNITLSNKKCKNLITESNKLCDDIKYANDITSFDEFISPLIMNGTGVTLENSYSHMYCEQLEKADGPLVYISKSVCKRVNFTRNESNNVSYQQIHFEDIKEPLYNTNYTEPILIFGFDIKEPCATRRLTLESNAYNSFTENLQDLANIDIPDNMHSITKDNAMSIDDHSEINSKAPQSLASLAQSFTSMLSLKNDTKINDSDHFSSKSLSNTVQEFHAQLITPLNGFFSYLSGQIEDLWRNCEDLTVPVNKENLLKYITRFNESLKGVNDENVDMNENLNEALEETLSLCGEKLNQKISETLAMLQEAADNLQRIKDNTSEALFVGGERARKVFNATAVYLKYIEIETLAKLETAKNKFNQIKDIINENRSSIDLHEKLDHIKSSSKSIITSVNSIITTLSKGAKKDDSCTSSCDCNVCRQNIKDLQDMLYDRKR
ncbi:hypothetical protein FQA39_LY03297 [Lamprigera yunnana]|nr:hypothetical protein FQA39_LY03297 [Lamprigera yunnana]